MAEGYESFLEQMKQGYQQRTGIPVDSASDVGIRFAVLAEQLALLQQELETAQQQAFAPDGDRSGAGDARRPAGPQPQAGGLCQRDGGLFPRGGGAGGYHHPARLLFDRANRQHPLCDRAGGGAQGRADPGGGAHPLPDGGQRRQRGRGQAQRHGDAGAGDCGGEQPAANPLRRGRGERPVAASAAAGQLQTGDQRHQCGLLLQSGDELSGGLLGQGAAAGQRGEHRRAGAARAGRQ